MILCRRSADLTSSQMDPFPSALFDPQTNFPMGFLRFCGELSLHAWGKEGNLCPHFSKDDDSTLHSIKWAPHSAARHSSHLRMEDVPLPLTFFQPKQQ